MSPKTNFFTKKIESDSQLVRLEGSFFKDITISLLREDGIHPTISGNKFRKLKYNVLQAVAHNHTTLLTFGGAYSNHIAAVACAGWETGLKTIGIIRGDELSEKIHLNPTLSYAQDCGMQLHFVSRAAYSRKLDDQFIDGLTQQFGEFYLIPEGGTNALAVKGCTEILKESQLGYDYICASVGTGGTLAGLVQASLPHQQVLGFSALKGTFQISEVEKYTTKTNFEITDTYCFGGYAKIDSKLIRFINEFKKETKIQLDPIYTGKMLFGIIDLIKKNYFKENSRILAVHTGGLQGISGMNEKLKQKNLPQIIV
ncbi:1-aminocyclopropane-1-carboxylate deaminase [Ulvibacter sp. MAR_2010_11]|uniref:1-aminocyclopropane-1-carboxylate deaminase/D-cysteine desulfhydrase n=1 Tax=Ulvibacter sp. MAR_2010_11 TaxID=1250229 RepID=UPI000C2C4050|nr:pyridoxal-phosphate dependent enzyme [Ulvibacter sp. MAR_2010_11]PKA83388.1 1-aminocyclopropane-1-carboxylate deaminase [Ulvibacter sp. MAR_2010_11]